MSASIDYPTRGHTRSAGKSSSAASSQYHQNSHHHNPHAHTQNVQNVQNEVQMLPSNQASQPTTPPRTPRRYNQAQNHSSLNASENGSKQRTRNKNRPKSVMTSPAIVKKDRSTPPLTSSHSSGLTSTKPLNTPSTTAYAGPTFHASPAPSALPIPSFYSRSVPDSPGVQKLKSSPSEDATATATLTATAPPKSQVQREESPLDLFFKADREEKARARSASFAQHTVIPGPFLPPAESPGHSQTPPVAGSNGRFRPGHRSRMPSNGMFAMDMDGESDPGTPYGPAFSTPYAQRISAARSTNSTNSLPRPAEIQQPTDKSEALKAYLFSGHIVSPPAVIPNGASGPLSPPTSGLSDHSAPSSPAGPWATGQPSRSSYFSQIYGPDAKSSNGITRASGRSSGLRQEVSSTKNAHMTSERCEKNSSSSSATHGFVGHLSPQIDSPNARSAYDNTTGAKSADLQGMEDSLRKILKLDSSGTSGVGGMGRVSAATVSVPGYVGGRTPPVNGMHDGVMGS